MRPTIERTFVCPDLDTQSDVILIREAMSNTPAVLEADVSISDHTVHVVMGDPEGEPSVRRHLESAGFPVKD